MKTKLLALFLLLPMLSPGKEFSSEEKTQFAEFYRKWSQVLEEFPDHPELKIIFVDLDQDGTDEAFATDYSLRQEDGTDWIAFRNKEGQWQPIRGFDNDAQKIVPSISIYGRSGDFFRVFKDNNVVEFIILSENYDKQAPQGLGPLIKTRFYLDPEGILRQEPIPDLERYLAYQGMYRSGGISKMERPKTEWFPDPSKTEKKPAEPAEKK